MRRSLALTAAAAAALGIAAAPSIAASKPKPIKQTWTATAPAPFPGSDAGAGGLTGCHAGVERVHKHTHTFKAPARGTLTAQIAFTGDWDFYLFDAKGRLATDSSSLPLTSPEKFNYKIKKPQTYSLVACNYLGSPTADGSLVFTFS